MLKFKTIADLAKLPCTDPAHAVIQDLLADFPKAPSIDGYIVLVEPGDTTIDLPEVKRTIADMSWDGVWKRDGYYHAVYLTNNEFALEFIIPAIIDVAIRDNLEAHISGSYMKPT